MLSKRYVFDMVCGMFLMWADTLRGQVGGGWALEMESFYFFGPCEMASSRQASAIWGPLYSIYSVDRTQSIQLKADSRGAY